MNKSKKIFELAEKHLYFHNWLRNYRSYPGIIEVKIEDLQKKQKNVMKEVADFLDKSLNAFLLEVSMLGQPYGSNLSSGDDSGGKIVQQSYYNSGRYVDEMTFFERWWIQRMFDKLGQESGYAKEISILKLSKAHKFKEFWRPMKNVKCIYILGNTFNRCGCFCRHSIC